jgi:hypothetical protein
MRSRQVVFLHGFVMVICESILSMQVEAEPCLPVCLPACLPACRLPPAACRLPPAAWVLHAVSLSPAA